MTDRLFELFLVVVFILVLGGTGALTNGAPVSVPWAEAIVPAGDDDDDDDGPPDIDELDCDELLDLSFELIDDPFDSAQFIDLKKLKKLIAECIASGGGGSSSLQERLVSGLPFTLNILDDGNFVGVSGIYDPATGNYTGNGVGTVAGFPNVTVVMELSIAPNGDITGTYSMGAGGGLPGGVPTVYSVTGVFPLKATPTPTPAPTDTPTPTPTPTSTPPAGVERTWGDSDCKGDAPNEVATRDSQAILRHVLEQNPLSQNDPCPDIGQTVTVDGVERTWGDWDCKGDAPNKVATRDSQAILRHVLEQNPLSQGDPCPAIGDLVQVSE